MTSWLLAYALLPYIRQAVQWEVMSQVLICLALVQVQKLHGTLTLPYLCPGPMRMPHARSLG